VLSTNYLSPLGIVILKAMLEAFTRRLRVSLQKLADQKDPSFLESAEHWRAIERDIHGTHHIEMDAMVTQAAFLLAVLATHVRYRDGREKGECLSQDTFSSLQSRLDSDDPRFGPYLRIASRGLPVVVEELAEIPQPGSGVDMFSPLYQAMFSSSQKHASGEHYTPTELCALMLDRLEIAPRTRILDPTCGAGAFIVGAIAKAKTAAPSRGDASFLANIHGRDLNPLAVIAARINAWLQARDLGTSFESFFETIRVADALSSPAFKFDVVIGNPPWVTLKDFSSKERQASILQQAKELRVAPDAHGVPQLELATVVFARCARDLLAPGGVAFFVMTRSFMDGKHCSMFRSLDGITEAEIWLFDGDAVFPKTFACLLGKLGTTRGSYFASQDTIPVQTWHVNRAARGGHRFAFNHVQETSYTPVNLGEARSAANESGDSERIGNLGRLIPLQQVPGLLPTSRAPYYKDKCYNGATVFPQSLLFVDIIEAIVDGDPSLVRIAPALGLNAKRPWNVMFYESAVVERRYLFPLVKGSELHPFGIHEPFHVFLPLRRGRSSFELDVEGLGDPPRTRARAHFRAIDEAYKKTCKNLERIKDLWSRVNFDNELTNSSMAKPFKVIIPDCGSTMAAAIVSNEFIVEHALHYIGLDDEREAWYLLGVLNAPCIEKDVMLRKSERHIGQLALDYAIPPFDPESPTHASIERLAREIEVKVRATIGTIAAKSKAANQGKYQCRACKSFVSPNATGAHGRSCKKIPTGMASPNGARLFIMNDGLAAKDISVKLSRVAVKRLISINAGIRSLLSSLDDCVLRLLGAMGVAP
jgi:hypothetical protein